MITPTPSQTFKDKLIEYYITAKVGYDIQHLQAFIFVLKSINYKYSSSFCKSLRYHAPEDMMIQNFKMLVGLQEIDMSSKFFTEHKEFVDIIFFTFLDLDIKISNRLKDKTSPLIPQPYRNRFIRFCEAYFRLLKNDFLEQVLAQKRDNRNQYFLYEVKRDKEEKRDIEKNIRQYWRSISNPEPSSNFANTSESPTFNRIVYIPMGRLNKRY